MRYVTFLVSLILPSLYVALITYHPQMLPTSLLINLSAQRENVPIPTLFEAIVMELMFEVIREAGIRAPRVLSTAITIVGAIVLGQTAVRAGLVTPAMVIVVAITALSSFVNPSYELAIAARLIRFAMMILAATFGLLGITLGLIVMVSHMNSLSSFGVPYLAPFAPLNLKAWKDTVIRFPIWLIRKRPDEIHPLKKNRMAKYRLRDGRPSKE
jgi:spore germination protein KA